MGDTEASATTLHQYKTFEQVVQKFLMFCQFSYNLTLYNDSFKYLLFFFLQGLNDITSHQSSGRLLPFGLIKEHLPGNVSAIIQSTCHHRFQYCLKFLLSKGILFPACILIMYSICSCAGAYSHGGGDGTPPESQNS